MLNTGLLSLRIRTSPKGGFTEHLSTSLGTTRAALCQRLEQWGLLLQQRQALGCCVAGGGPNTWLCCPSSPNVELAKTPLITLGDWVSICSLLRATATTPCQSITGSFCPHLEARSWVPGSGLGTFWPGCDFWGQGGSWLLYISPADPWNHRNQGRLMGGEGKGSEAK